eukprot:CAMPEP_0206462718 /NCGR_PEP_ID=MMETSP0324_2-20121206/26150_1 /ASSEMBLY_ACC=CAM_ASM_000836 /TAXON_ID=2866 /ORGANISM="Crypthecodinium cohnii, Strain Seligo" /LENGTH=873 /DNA_ID=CAMNT_0053934937 /DNA_START=58 /DNA_END=2676 /DNA_ORIENTATION=+
MMGRVGDPTGMGMRPNMMQMAQGQQKRPLVGDAMGSGMGDGPAGKLPRPMMPGGMGVVGGSGLNLDVPSNIAQALSANNNAILKSIETMTGVQCAIQPAMPGTDTTKLTINGAPQQVDRCRELVVSLVNGSGQQPGAGSPVMGMPGIGGMGFIGSAGSASGSGLLPTGLPTGLPTMTAPGMTAGMMRPPQAQALAAATAGLNPMFRKMAGGETAGGQLDVTKLGTLLSSLGSNNSPESASYYTQVLAAATQMVTKDEEKPESKPARPEMQAFDREALARLAKQAADEPQEPEPAPPMPAAQPQQQAPPISMSIPPSFSAWQQHQPPAPEMNFPVPEGLPSPTPAPAPASQAPAAAPPPDVSSSSSRPPAPAPALAPPAAPAPAAPISIQFAPSGPETSKKDASSVFSFLQAAQDNLARSRAGKVRAGAQPSVFGSATSANSSQSETLSPWQSLCKRIDEVSSSTAPSLEKEIVSSLPKLEPRQAAELVVRAQAASQLRTHSLLDELCRALVVPIPRFRSSDLARLAETFSAWTSNLAHGEERVRLSEAVKHYFNGLHAEVSLRLMDMALGDLARAATVFANVGVGGTKLFASIARAAGARMDRFAPGELVMLVAAFEKEGCFQTALYEGLARSLKGSLRDVAPKDVLRGMASLASCGIRDEALAHSVGDALVETGVSNGVLPMEDCVKLAWTFCVLDLYHEGLFRAVFARVADTPVQESETLCQLYEVHLTLAKSQEDSYKDFELDEETVSSLRHHYKKHHVRAKPARSSERLHDDVADALAQVIDGSVSTSSPTNMGIFVDVWASTSKSRRSSSSSTPIVAIEVDGPHSIIRSMDPLENNGPAARIRGEIAFRRRLLQKCGTVMVVFSEDKW